MKVWRRSADRADIGRPNGRRLAPYHRYHLRKCARWTASGPLLLADPSREITSGPQWPRRLVRRGHLFVASSASAAAVSARTRRHT
jgi:hypothetical protein